jgi:anaerobic selenocysteine-containing dehydrogenase
MECVVVQDLFLNETANYAHVFLPGSTFLEKDGTFTNAERRIQRVRKVMTPRTGYADWEITSCSPSAGLDWTIATRPRSWTRSRADADLRRRLLRKLDELRLGAVAVQRARRRRHAGHAHRRLRARQGPLHVDRVHCNR